MPDYKKAARRAAAKYGVDQGIFLAMIQQESGFNPNVTSPAGAQGIAQFIPSTAKSYGVNLGDGRVTDDLEGAARYLRDNLKRTGGNYTKALSIYNSGRPDGYLSIPETKNYVRNIRAMSKRYGSDPSVKSGGNVSSQGDKNPQTQTKTTVTGAGFDPGPGASALAQLAQQQARPTVQTTVPTPPQFAASAAMPQGYQAPSAAPVQQQPSGLTDLLSQIGAGGQSLPQVDVKTETSTSSSGGSSGESSGGSSGGSRKGLKGDFGGQLKELFYNGPGGVNVDNGKRVPKGFVSGHTDHVHVAAGPKTVKTLARLAQDMGLTVRELAPFDKVDPVHTSGSYHYRKQAADISGDPRKMAEYSRRVARLYGIKA